MKFGGGKVIRDGMGQSQATRAEGAMDTVITNALIPDHSGIYKADIDLKDGRIAAIGKAGNPDTQNAVTIISGPSTEIRAFSELSDSRGIPKSVLKWFKLSAGFGGGRYGKSLLS